MAVAKLDVVEQLFTDDGLLNAGGSIETYAAGTSTPLATFSDVSGLIPNANPLVLPLNGRADLWFTIGSAYKVIVKSPAGVVLRTIDGISAPNPSATSGSQFADIVFQYPGGPPPAATAGTTAGWIGGERVDRAINFAANFGGSFGFALTAPTATFAITIRKNATHNDNGTQIGTVTVATNGTFTFATAGGGAVQSLAIGDTIHAFGPVTADTTIADFGFTLAGTLAS